MKGSTTKGIEKNIIMICKMVSKSTIPFWDFIIKEVLVLEVFKGL
jgi:hypothetical protein